MCFFLFFFFLFFSFLSSPFSFSIFGFVRLPFNRSWSFSHAGTWTGRLDLRVWISCVCDVHVCKGVYWGSARSGNVSSCWAQGLSGCPVRKCGLLAQVDPVSPVLLSIYLGHVAAWCCFASDYTSHC